MAPDRETPGSESAARNFAGWHDAHAEQWGLIERDVTLRMTSSNMIAGPTGVLSILPGWLPSSGWLPG